MPEKRRDKNSHSKSRKKEDLIKQKERKIQRETKRCRVYTLNLCILLTDEVTRGHFPLFHYDLASACFSPLLFALIFPFFLSLRQRLFPSNHKIELIRPTYPPLPRDALDKSRGRHRQTKLAI